MIFEVTELPGVMLVRLDPHHDERGLFARLFCTDEFAAVGIDFSLAQMSLSRNRAQFTLRGMHFQLPPYAEAKLVRCARGRIYDVAIDIRPDSGTFLKWQAFELDAETGDAVFIPEGYAHGFLTLEPDTDVVYMMNTRFEPGAARGIRWDDPALALRWPAPPAVIGPRDTAWPSFATRPSS